MFEDRQMCPFNTGLRPQIGEIEALNPPYLWGIHAEIFFGSVRAATELHQIGLRLKHTPTRTLLLPDRHVKALYESPAAALQEYKFSQSASGQR